MYTSFALMKSRLLSRVTLGKFSGSVTRTRVSDGGSLGGLNCNKLLKAQMQ
jgi:hypothetical protein